MELSTSTKKNYYMIPSWKALCAFFLSFHTQILTPSHPDGRMVGIDFGEPTRNCAGRGQICRIDDLAGWSPEALGELWTDESGTLRLAIWECFWESEEERPAEAVLENGKIIFEAPAQVFKPK